MSFDRLLQAKERVEKYGPTPTQPGMFEHDRQKTRKTRVISGHLDKQTVCRCGYDQACTTLVCARCDRKLSHGSVAIIERDDLGSITTFYYHPCRCGAKKWLYGCEAMSVRRHDIAV